MPTHFSGNPEKTKALNSFIYLTRAANTVENRLFAGDHLDGLTHSQFSVLETLYHLGSMCQGELSRKLLKSTGNMTLVLDNLENLGYIHRKHDQIDRRMVHIHLSEKGKEKIEEVFPRVVEAIVQEFSVLTPEEQDTLGFLCKKVGKGKLG